jgi:ubiquinone/menaquinone biosynthesis C-methylase UbiE
VPAVLAAAEVTPGQRLLDVSTGTGEAALAALPIISTSGLVIGADIAPAMLEAASSRLNQSAFLPVAADGLKLPFSDSSFDAVVCQLGLQFFPDPALGLPEFRRVLRTGCFAAVCVIATPDRAPMWGILADAIGRFLPAQREIVHLSFSLADPKRLERLFTGAGFQDVRVKHATREGTNESFDDYWEPIEAGVGSIPQAYLTLSEANRQSVREEVRADCRGSNRTGS